MDQEILVEQAQVLTQHLDKTKAAPKAVMLVVSEETGNMKLWMVPRKEDINKQEFYRIVAESITNHGIKGIDVGFVELVKSSNPAMRATGLMMKADGINSLFVSGNVFNGILLPDGVIIRMEL